MSFKTKTKEELLEMIEQDFDVTKKYVNDLLRRDVIYFLQRQGFFAHIVAQLKKNIVLDVPIAAVNVINGISQLYIHPINYSLMEKRHRAGVLMHEVMHIVLFHIFRRESKDPYIWNLATDCAINQMIPNNDEIAVPEGGIFPETFKEYGIALPPKLSADEYYDLLIQEKDKLPPHLNGSFQEKDCPYCNGSGEQDGGMETNASGDGKSEGHTENGQGNGIGESNQNDAKDAGNDNTRESENGKENKKEPTNTCPHCQGTGKKLPKDWHEKWDKNEGSERVNEAAVKKQIKEAYAKHAGTLPGDIRAYIEDIIASKNNWRAILKMFAAKYIRSGVISTYKKENRRLGNLAKGRRKTHRLTLALFVDTSASVTDENLAQFSGEIMAIWRTGAKILVMECDTHVHNMYEFDGKLELLEYQGRGGTSFIPPFNKLIEERIQVDAVIYLTDGYGQAPDTFHIPTLWVLTPDGQKPYDSNRNEVKWGDVIKLD